MLDACASLSTTALHDMGLHGHWHRKSHPEEWWDKPQPGLSRSLKVCRGLADRQPGIGPSHGVTSSPTQIASNDLNK